MTGTAAQVEAIRAYHAPFSSTGCLSRLWREVSAGRAPTWQGFQNATRAFYRRINAGKGADAQEAGKILQAAGYQLGTGDRAPVLEINIPKLEAARLASFADPGVRARLAESRARAADRPGGTDNLLHTYIRLNIDHLEPLSPRQGEPPTSNPKALDPANLRFMTSWDNSVRGDRFNADDTPRQ